MNILYDEFVEKIKKEKYSLEILKIKYFQTLNNEDLYNLLNYKSNKFKLYINLILKFQDKGLFFNSIENSKIRKLFNILFNLDGLRNRKLLIEILSNTNIVFNNFVVDFAYTFLTIKEDYKIKIISDIVTKVKFIDKINIKKLIDNIRNTKNSYQAKCLGYLFTIENIFKEKRLARFGYLILDNPNCKYLKDMVMAIDNLQTIKTNHDSLWLIQNFLKINNIEQANLLFNIVTDSNMLQLNHNILEKVLNIVVNVYYVEYFPYIEELIEKKSIISDLVFEILFDNLMITNNQYQREGIVSLVNYPNIINDNYKLTIIIEKLLKVKKGFHMFSILDLLGNDILFENISINYVLESILKTNKDYQANSIVEVVNYSINNLYFREIIEVILETNNYLLCKYIVLFVKIPDILGRYNFLIILKKLLKLKYEYQMQTFLNLITLEKVLEQKNLYILDYLKKANIYQCDSLIYLLNQNMIVDENYLSLIKYLFVFNDKKYIYLITKIILNIEILGHSKAVELIDRIINNFEKLDIFDNLLNSELGNSFFDVDPEFELEQELFKIKRMKIKDILSK